MLSKLARCTLMTTKSGTGSRFLAVSALLLTTLIILGCESEQATEFTVDESVVPDPIESVDPATGESRPLGAMVDEEGVRDQFIANELLIEVPNDAKLSAFVTRYGASVVETIEFEPDPEDDLIAIHVVRIDATKMADPGTLPANLAVLDPEADPEMFRVSDPTALGLLATWAEARVAGYDVDINWIGSASEVTEADVVDRSLADNPNGPSDGRDWRAGPLTAWSANPAQWIHFASGTTQDIGVSEAWDMLAGTGRLGDVVDVGFVDVGFVDPATFSAHDYPEDTDFKSVGVFVTEHGVGEGSKPWHGTRAANVALGRVDNGAGGAGVGYPVADQVIYAYFNHPGSPRKMVRAFRRLKREGVDIIGTSYSWTHRSRFTGNRMRRVAARMMRNGIIVVAAAGNDSRDIDRKRRLGVRERRHYLPCEARGVVCVGALAHDSVSRASFSNWGNKDVDIWAPGFALVGPTPTCGGCSIQTFSGTSAASPYVAGVVALIWAAEPDASRSEVLDALFDNARPINSGNVKLVVNARDAVDAQLASAGPALKLLSPADPSEVEYSQTVLLSAWTYAAELGEPTFTWSVNDVPLSLTSSQSWLSRDQLTVGANVIDVTATFGDGTALSTSATVTRDVPGELIILSPMDQQCIRVEDAAAGVALRSEPPDPSVVWKQNGTAFVTEGGDVTAPLPLRSIASHSLRARLSDGTDIDEDRVTVRIVSDSVEASSVTITSPEPAIESGLIHFTAVTTDSDGAVRWVVEEEGGVHAAVGTGRSFSTVVDEGRYIVRVFVERDVDPDPSNVDLCVVAADAMPLFVQNLF